MKFSRLALLFFVTLLLVGCGKEDENSVIPGYIKPGDFRPKGIFTKEYTLTDPTFTGGDGTCSGDDCLAVYGLWSTNNVPVEGLAVKDDDTADSHMLMKLTRVKGAQWQIKLTYKGIAYKNNLVPASAIDLVFCTTAIPTLPAYDPDAVPDSGDEFKASETFLVKATATVINSIALQTDEEVPKTITLNSGDEIIAQAYSAVGTSACP
jgi:hypothetical protein